jgi:prevent-host-death family protein
VVTERDLRRRGCEVLDRVARGEMVMITRHGAEVAELRPVGRRALSGAELVTRRVSLPKVDPVLMRGDMADLLNTAL